MSPRSADSALVVDLHGVLRPWAPGIAASAARRAGLPPGALDRAAFADAATCGPSSPARSATPSGGRGSPHGWSPSTGRPRPELGVAKPDPEVFAAVCSALGLPPHRCVFVDDQQA